MSTLDTSSVPSTVPESVMTEMYDSSREYVSLSTSNGSFLNTVMSNGMDYNPKAVLEYLDSRWECIIDVLISQGVHTQRYYERVITYIRDKLRILRSTADTETELTLTEIQSSASRHYEILKSLLTLGTVHTKLDIIRTITTELTETRCISKTSLCLSEYGNDSPIDGLTLYKGWTDLFGEVSLDDMNSHDDRKVFRGRMVADTSRWNHYRVNAVKHYATTTIPSGWSYNSDVRYVNRLGYYPRSIGKHRCRIGLLLSALDFIGSYVFVSYDKYSAWTTLIRNEICTTAGPRPAPPTPPPPPMPTINGDEMKISGNIEPDDVDPITLEPFTEGDEIFKMRCCRNKLLKSSIQGILASGRTQNCPLCRTSLFV